MMKEFNFKEIDFLDTIKCDWEERNYQYFVRPLFHGTRRYALECSKEEIAKIKEYSLIIIKFIQKIEKTISLDVVGQYFKRKKERNCFASAVVSQIEKSSLYQYDSLYLTTSIYRAISFSKNACGEIGQTAYDNAIAIKELGIETNDIKIDEAIDYIIKTVPKFKESERVVLIFENVNYDDLKSESSGKAVLGKTEEKRKAYIEIFIARK